MREKDIESACIEWLRWHRHWCQKVHSGSLLVTRKDRTYRVKLADEGTPDIVACVHGRFVGIEVKRDEKARRAWERQDEAQHLQHEGIAKAGGEVIVCCSVEEMEADMGKMIENWLAKSRLQKGKKRE